MPLLFRQCIINVIHLIINHPYNLGDVVGVLLDLELIEIRFYLNGEDLGTAFEGFSITHPNQTNSNPSYLDFFPAISLNSRQSLRLNFGQEKFLFPPDEIDGFAFNGVIQSLLPTSNHLNKINQALSELKKGKNVLSFVFS
jgi:hypothetical protein